MLITSAILGGICGLTESASLFICFCVLIVVAFRWDFNYINIYTHTKGVHVRSEDGG